MEEIDSRLDSENPLNPVNVQKAKRIHDNELLLFKKALELCTDDCLVDSDDRAGSRTYKLPTGQIIEVRGNDYIDSQHNPLQLQAKDGSLNGIYVKSMSITREGVVKGNYVKIDIDDMANIRYEGSNLSSHIVGTIPAPRENYDPTYYALNQLFPRIKIGGKNDININVNNKGDTLIDVIDNLPGEYKDDSESILINDFKSFLQPLGREDLEVETDAERMIRTLKEQLQQSNDKNAQLVQQNTQLEQQNTQLGNEKDRLEQQNTQLGNEKDRLEQQKEQLLSQNSQQLIVIDAYKNRVAYLENIITKQKEFVDNIKKRFDNIKTSISTVKENLKPTSFMEKIAAKLSKKKNDKISEQSDGIDTIVAGFETDYRRFSMNQSSSQETTDEYVKNYVQARSQETPIQTPNRGFEK